MYSYKISIEAEKDIIRIYEYGFAKFGIIQADKYYDMLFECFNKIAFNPFYFQLLNTLKKTTDIAFLALTPFITK
jgi:toxin ParE1/3/4